MRIHFSVSEEMEAQEQKLKFYYQEKTPLYTAELENCEVCVHLDLLKGLRSECNPIGTGLSDQPEFLQVFRDGWTGKRREMGKDVEGGSTWKGYEKSKSEMREGGKGEGRKGEYFIVCLLWSPGGDRFPYSSLMQARGSARGKGQEFGASGKMSADDVEKMDRMQAWQETSSLETVIFEKFKNKPLSCIIV